MLLLGLDVGTTGVKCVAFDERGVIRARAYRMYDAELPSGGRRELAPGEIWRCTSQAIAAVAAAIQGEAAVLSVSSFGEAFVMIDRAGKEIGPAMVFTDRRGENEQEEIMGLLPEEEVARICGLVPKGQYSASKMLYLKRHEPAMYENTAFFLLIADYIYYKLCGERYTDYSLAARTQLFDVEKKMWSGRMLSCFGIPSEKLSSPVPGGTAIGRVSKKVAEELGLSPDTQLVTGGHDQICCALGAGMLPETPVCSMGTSECITPILSRRLPAEVTLRHSFSSEPFFEADTYCTLLYNACAGLLIDWFFEAFAPQARKDGRPDYAFLESKAPRDPTRIMVLPYLLGSGTPYVDPRARLCIWGLDAGARGETVFKACIEGLSLDQRLNLSLLEDSGVCVSGLVAVGGGSKSAFWLQTKANVLQRDVLIPECNEAGALGCAILCASATGLYPDIRAAAREMCRISHTVSPDMQYAQAYAEMSELYKGLYHDCKRINDSISG